MKTYDVTISLRIVSMKGLDATKQYQTTAQGLANSIAGNDASTACEVRSVEVVDHDSLPQQARLCIRCERPVT